MSLQEIKKSEIDEPSFDEKVLLATSTLNWFAVRQEKILNQFKQIEGSKKGTVNGIIKNHTEIQEKVLAGLINILEEWGNFIDGQDALDEIDNIVTEPTYDILYERYEPETPNPKLIKA